MAWIDAGFAPTLEYRMGGDQAALIKDANDVGQLMHLHHAAGAIGTFFDKKGSGMPSTHC